MSVSSASLYLFQLASALWPFTSDYYIVCSQPPRALNVVESGWWWVVVCGFGVERWQETLCTMHACMLDNYNWVNARKFVVYAIIFRELCENLLRPQLCVFFYVVLCVWCISKQFEYARGREKEIERENRRRTW